MINPWERALLIAVLLWGVAVRFYALESAPSGIEMEEAQVLMWGEKTVREGTPLLYVPEGAEWENLPGTLFSLMQKIFGGSFRFAPTLLSLFELLAIWFFAKRILGNRGALWATALVALSPWHGYYSRVPASCLGIGALLCLAIAFKGERPWAQVPLHVVGLFYNTAYRLLYLRLCVQSLFSGSRRRLYSLGAVGGLSAGLLLLSASPVTKFFTRGSYHLTQTRSLSETTSNLLATFVAPVLPVAPAYGKSRQGFLADGVHSGFVRALQSHPPLGWGFAVLTCVSLGLVALAVVRPRYRDQIPAPLREELWFLLAFFAILSPFGPQMSRLIAVLPLLAILAAWGLERMRVVLPRRLYPCVVLLLLFSTGWSQFTTFQGMSDQDRMEPIYHGRYRELADYLSSSLPDASGETVVLVAYHGAISAMYWSNQTRKFDVMLPQDPQAFERELNLRSEGRTQYVALSLDPPDAADFSWGEDPKEEMEAMIARVEARAEVLDDRFVLLNGRRVARLIKIQWPYLYQSASR